MRALLLVAVLVHSQSAPAVDCEAVRAKVQEYGYKLAYTWAIGQVAIGNYSWGQFRAAKRCLDRPKGKG